MKVKTTFSILLLAVLSAEPAFAIEPVSKCDALAAWAAGLETLPTDYASFISLPESHRRALYQRLSATERAGLWQEQWEQALRLPEWNAEQRALIAEASRIQTPSSFAAARPVEAIRDLESRVLEAFPRTDALRVFYRLGPRESLMEASASWVCNCSLEDPSSCEFSGGCQDLVCFQPIDGCGFIGGLPCDGRCP